MLWPHCQGHWHSNFVGASSLLRLHSTVAMAAAIVTSRPSPARAPPPPWRRRGLQGNASRVDPRPQSALPPAKRSRGAKRQLIFLHLMNSLNRLLVCIIQADFSLIPAAFCTAGCICLDMRCLDMG